MPLLKKGEIVANIIDVIHGSSLKTDEAWSLEEREG